MKMKRMAAMVCCLSLMAVLVAGCGKEPTTDSTPTTTGGEVITTTVQNTDVTTTVGDGTVTTVDGNAPTTVAPSGGQNNTTTQKPADGGNATTTTAPADNKAQIMDIYIDGTAISGFSVDQLLYVYPMAANATKIPQVSALKGNGSGSLTVKQATALPGAATVALNGKTYTIRFIKEDKSAMLNNTYYRLKTTKKLKIAYFGGSVTDGHGASRKDVTSWRALTTAWLKSQYSDADITDWNAAVGGTGTEFGAYRAYTDLKLADAATRPDLVFVEFAINDMYDKADSKKYMESIVRTIYEYAPEADIVMVFTTDLSRKDTDYSAILAHKEVAAYYGIPCVYLGSRLYQDIVKEKGGSAPTAASDAVWKKYFIDIVHPTDAGYAKYASYMQEFLADAFASKTVPASLKKVTLPKETLSTLPKAPHAVNFSGLTFQNDNFEVDSNGSVIGYQSGKSFTFEFTGTELKFWVYGTADGSTASVNIDGKFAKSVDMSGSNHKVVTVATGLSAGKHTVKVVLGTTNGKCYMEVWRVFMSGAGLEGITITK